MLKAQDTSGTWRVGKTPLKSAMKKTTQKPKLFGTSAYTAAIENDKNDSEGNGRDGTEPSHSMRKSGPSKPRTVSFKQNNDYQTDTFKPFFSSKDDEVSAAMDIDKPEDVSELARLPPRQRHYLEGQRQDRTPQGGRQSIGEGSHSSSSSTKHRPPTPYYPPKDFGLPDFDRERGAEGTGADASFSNQNEEAHTADAGASTESPRLRRCRKLLEAARLFLKEEDNHLSMNFEGKLKALAEFIEDIEKDEDLLTEGNEGLIAEIKPMLSIHLARVQRARELQPAPSYVAPVSYSTRLPTSHLEGEGEVGRRVVEIPKPSISVLRPETQLYVSVSEEEEKAAFPDPFEWTKKAAAWRGRRSKLRDWVRRTIERDLRKASMQGGSEAREKKRALENALRVLNDLGSAVGSQGVNLSGKRIHAQRLRSLLGVVFTKIRATDDSLLPAGFPQEMAVFKRECDAFLGDRKATEDSIVRNALRRYRTHVDVKKPVRMSFERFDELADWAHNARTTWLDADTEILGSISTLAELILHTEWRDAWEKDTDDVNSETKEILAKLFDQGLVFAQQMAWGEMDIKKVVAPLLGNNQDAVQLTEELAASKLGDAVAKENHRDARWRKMDHDSLWSFSASLHSVRRQQNFFSLHRWNGFKTPVELPRKKTNEELLKASAEEVGEREAEKSRRKAEADILYAKAKEKEQEALALSQRLVSDELVLEPKIREPQQAIDRLMKERKEAKDWRAKKAIDIEAAKQYELYKELSEDVETIRKNLQTLRTEAHNLLFDAKAADPEIRDNPYPIYINPVTRKKSQRLLPEEIGFIEVEEKINDEPKFGEGKTIPPEMLKWKAPKIGDPEEVFIRGPSNEWVGAPETGFLGKIMQREVARDLGEREFSHSTGPLSQ